MVLSNLVQYSNENNVLYIMIQLSLQLYAPGMEEINRVKVQLPERRQAIPFPEIQMALEMRSSKSKWKEDMVNKSKLSNLIISTFLTAIQTYSSALNFPIQTLYPSGKKTCYFSMLLQREFNLFIFIPYGVNLMKDQIG